MNVNKAILIGRVGKDPEVKHLDNNRTVANFSLATSETYKDKEGNKNETVTWHSVVIWGKLAGVVEKYVHKGDLLYLEGKITTRSWEKDGTKHYMTEIVCHTMQMLGGKKDGNISEKPNSSNEDKGEIDYERPPKYEDSEPNINDPNDDLPF